MLIILNLFGPSLKLYDLHLKVIELIFDIDAAKTILRIVDPDTKGTPVATRNIFPHSKISAIKFMKYKVF